MISLECQSSSSEWAQGQQAQQQLARRNEKGWLEPLMFEEGKAALLNIRGPYVLCRDRLSDVSLEEFLPLLKVSSTPVLTPLLSLKHACLIGPVDS